MNLSRGGETLLCTWNVVWLEILFLFCQQQILGLLFSFVNFNAFIVLRYYNLKAAYIQSRASKSIRLLIPLGHFFLIYNLFSLQLLYSISILFVEYSGQSVQRLVQISWPYSLFYLAAVNIISCQSCGPKTRLTVGSAQWPASHLRPQRALRVIDELTATPEPWNRMRPS